MPPHMNGSVVFTGWRQCASACYRRFLWLTGVYITSGSPMGSALFARHTANGSIVMAALRIADADIIFSSRGFFYLISSSLI